MPVFGLHVSKSGVCTVRLWGTMVRLARAHSGVFLEIIADCKEDRIPDWSQSLLDRCI